ncbi:MAG: hypothetical protein IJO75_04495 [Clostridia bacterium]|nr:hypothetical protein [Clostridia bacterium]
MKTANKVIALVLCTIMLMLTVGCEQKDRTSLLPFGLELGNDYEEVQNKIDIGELKDSEANDGYISNLKYISEEEEITEILGTSEGISDVAIGLAFNADKKLYEFYCFFTVENEKLSATNDIIRQKFTKVAGEEEEECNGIALWENEEYVINYRSENPLEAFLGEDASCIISIHSYELDFK